ncbi:MAG: hypothetical protein WCS30_03735 [Selenomonadaceae bacterium]
MQEKEICSSKEDKKKASFVFGQGTLIFAYIVRNIVESELSAADIVMVIG